MQKHADSIDVAILNRIWSGQHDHIRVPQVFIDLGSRAAVDEVRSRSCQNGSIRRTALGPLGPSYDAVQELVQRKADVDVFPTGAHAANVLGLSDQFPMRSWHHLPTGPSRRIGSCEFETLLRHVSPRFVPTTSNPKAGEFMLALRWRGKRAMDVDVISTLGWKLRPSDRTRLSARAAYARHRSPTYSTALTRTLELQQNEIKSSI
jgi:hypothetical protein